MSVAYHFMLLGVEDPYTFNPNRKAIREPFDYYQFVHTYIRPMIDFKNSYIGNVSISTELEDNIRQENDVGKQYRSGIYFYTDEQYKLACEALEKHKILNKKIVTEILPATKFYIE